MFNVKFISVMSNGKEVRHCLQCPHYSIQEYDDGWGVVTYKDFMDISGIERFVATAHKTAFDRCYIENIAGKTIETLIRR